MGTRSLAGTPRRQRRAHRCDGGRREFLPHHQAAAALYTGGRGIAGSHYRRAVGQEEGPETAYRIAGSTDGSDRCCRWRRCQCRRNGCECRTDTGQAGSISAATTTAGADSDTTSRGITSAASGGKRTRSSGTECDPEPGDAIYASGSTRASSTGAGNDNTSDPDIGIGSTAADQNGYSTAAPFASQARFGGYG